MTVITEADLRRMWNGNEEEQFSLPRNSRLTPSARDFVKHWKLKISYPEDPSSTGDLPVEPSPDRYPRPAWNKPGSFPIDMEGELPVCSTCGHPLDDKPGHMTQLDATRYVPKSEHRLLFRGKMDTLHAYFLLTGAKAATYRSTDLAGDLNTLAAYCREIMSAEYNGRETAPLQIRDLTEDRIHEMTHQPEASFGISHLVPEDLNHEMLLQLNLLRCMVRETELTAASVFTGSLEWPGRPDLIRALNRLSSAVYYLELRFKAENSLRLESKQQGSAL